MLQGNSFETERFVSERREQVRHEVEQERQYWINRGPIKVQARWLSVAVILGSLLGLVSLVR